MQNSVIKLAEF